RAHAPRLHRREARFDGTALRRDRVAAPAAHDLHQADPVVHAAQFRADLAEGFAPPRRPGAADEGTETQTGAVREIRADAPCEVGNHAGGPPMNGRSVGQSVGRSGLLAALLLPPVLSAQQASAWDVMTPRGKTRVIDFTVDEGTWMSVDISRDGQWMVFDLL